MNFIEFFTFSRNKQAAKYAARGAWELVDKIRDSQKVNGVIPSNAAREAGFNTPSGRQQLQTYERVKDNEYGNAIRRGLGQSPLSATEHREQRKAYMRREQQATEAAHQARRIANAKRQRQYELVKANKIPGVTLGEAFPRRVK